VAWFISLPFNIRLALLFVFGLVVGGQINRAIYGLAWDSRPIGPWTTKHKDAPQRSWWDRLPIVGWFGLAREEKVHGKLYWFRPMLIELAMGIGFAMLYQFEMDGGLHEWVIPEGRVPTPPVAAADLHWEYLSHIVLITLMMVATFIDFDEKTIPDTITVPGTMIGFLIATIAPSSLLPSFFVTGAAPNFKVTESVLMGAGLGWRARVAGRDSLSVGLVVCVGPENFLLPSWLHEGAEVSGGSHVSQATLSKQCDGQPECAFCSICRVTRVDFDCLVLGRHSLARAA
jgi:prepilin signal peptidase PulO-like enzyme (type II secretory pathway)